MNIKLLYFKFYLIIQDDDSLNVIWKLFVSKNLSNPIVRDDQIDGHKL